MPPSWVALNFYGTAIPGCALGFLLRLRGPVSPGPFLESDLISATLAVIPAGEGALFAAVQWKNLGTVGRFRIIRLVGHQRCFGINIQPVLTRIPQMMRLKKISLLKERISKPSEYPFNIPTIASLNELEISSRVCFFVGENGTGKSTLLEAIAAHYGFGLEGGNRNFSPKTTDSVAAIEPLAKALRLSFTKREGGGFYLRAESFFNVASYVDQVGALGSYGDKSLHDQSHGESFLSLLQNRFTRSGFYLMDEPEAALSPQRQLSFLILFHELVKGNDGIQFIIVTHSPLLLAYPGAQIFSFDEGNVHQIEYRESQPFQLVSRFMAAPERYINALFSELPFCED